MDANPDSIRLTLTKLRGLAFLLAHFNTGAALDHLEANGIGASLGDLADQIEEELE